ncbi:hypothetical protein ACKVMT_07050 [Halobacteriales archaeon Cl-PHB]
MQTERAESLGELVRAYGSVLGMPEAPEEFEGISKRQATVSAIAGAGTAVLVGMLVLGPVLTLYEFLGIGIESYISSATALGLTLMVCKFVAWPVSDYVAGIPREVPA